MANYLFVDCETNGLPLNFGAPISVVSNWPEVLQIAWVLTDSVGRIKESQGFIVDPKGRYKLDKQAAEVHHLTEDVLSTGTPLKEVLRAFVGSLGQAHILVAHNIEFDYPVIAAELCRYKQEPSLARMAAMQRICTMRSTIEYCGLPGKYGKPKWPKLPELYLKLFGREYVETHSAYPDVQALVECFWALKERKIIEV